MSTYLGRHRADDGRPSYHAGLYATPDHTPAHAAPQPAAVPEWIRDVMAASDSHARCETQSTQSCPTGEHTNPAPRRLYRVEVPRKHGPGEVLFVREDHIEPWRHIATRITPLEDE